MATYSSLDETLERQCEKLRVLEAATTLIKGTTLFVPLKYTSAWLKFSIAGKDAVREELIKMRADVSEMSHGVEEMRTALEKMKQQNDQCRVGLFLSSFPVPMGNRRNLVNEMNAGVGDAPRETGQENRSHGAERTVRIDSPSWKGSGESVALERCSGDSVASDHGRRGGEAGHSDGRLQEDAVQRARSFSYLTVDQ